MRIVPPRNRVDGVGASLTRPLWTKLSRGPIPKTCADAAAGRNMTMAALNSRRTRKRIGHLSIVISAGASGSFTREAR